MTTTEAELSVTSALTALVLAGDELAGSAVSALLVDAGVTLVDPSHPPAGSVALVVEPSEEVWDQVARSGAPALMLIDGELADADIVAAALNGTCGFVDVSSTPGELISAIGSVAHHGAALSPRHGRVVLDALRQRGHGTGTIALTLREQQILEAIADGESVKQTARRLGVSPRTIDNTQRVMFLKLGVRNRAHAVSRAHELGLLKSEKP